MKNIKDCTSDTDEDRHLNIPPTSSDSSGETSQPVATTKPNEAMKHQPGATIADMIVIYDNMFIQNIDENNDTDAPQNQNIHVDTDIPS